MHSEKSTLLKTVLISWKDDSVVKSTYLQRTRVQFPASMQGGLQAPATPASEDLTPLASAGTCTHIHSLTKDTQTHTQKEKERIDSKKKKEA